MAKEPLKWHPHAIVVGTILAADLLLLILAYRRIDFATAVALHNAGPILVIMLAPVIAGDPFRLRSMLLAVAGCMAVAVVCGAKISRSAERRVGKECVSRGRSGWSPVQEKKNNDKVQRYRYNHK